MSYTYDWEIKDSGYTELPLEAYSDWKKKARDYVEKYLSPSVEHAKCGWSGCEYHLFKNPFGDIDEYISLDTDVRGRYINVSGDSLGAIAEAIWNCVFK